VRESPIPQNTTHSEPQSEQQDWQHYKSKGSKHLVRIIYKRCLGGYLPVARSRYLEKQLLRAITNSTNLNNLTYNQPTNQSERSLHKQPTNPRPKVVVGWLLSTLGHMINPATTKQRSRYRVTETETLSASVRVQQTRSTSVDRRDGQPACSDASQYRPARTCSQECKELPVVLE
jgi:hypothetical protein